MSLKESLLRVKVEVTDIFQSPRAKGSELGRDDLDDLERDEQAQTLSNVLDQVKNENEAALVNS